MSTIDTRIDPAPWLDALERVVLVPADARERTLTRVEAAATLRCPVEVVDALVDAGLPVAGRAPSVEPLLDLHDVVNVGLEAGQGASRGEIGAQVLLRFAASPPERWTAPRRWDVVREHRCEHGDACGGGPWRVASPALEAFGGRVERWADVPGPDGSAAEVHLRVATAGRVDTVHDARIADVYRAALADFGSGRVRYHWLPSRLRTDPATISRLGAGDCAASSVALADELTRIGVEARTRTVTALGTAGVDHAWAEARDTDGRFKPLDPVFGFLGERVRGGDGAFADFCCGSASARVLPWECGADAPVAEHLCAAGRPAVDVSVSATLVQEAA